MFHLIGSEPISYFNSSSSDTSLAVVQFFAFVTGEAPVHAPDNGFRTVQLVGEEMYCLGCYGVRWHDVIYGELSAFSSQHSAVSLPAQAGDQQAGGQVSAFRIARCRVCEKVGAV